MPFHTCSDYPGIAGALVIAAAQTVRTVEKEAE